MESNILKGSTQEIAQIKERVVLLNNCIEQNRVLETSEKQAEKNIVKMENFITDEIKKVTRQRKSQLEATFDEQISTVSAKLKTAEVNKEKTKKKAVMQRIDSETADFRSEDEELHLAGKSVFKQEKIPFLYNNRLFFALYFPKGLGDLAIVVVSLALAFFVVPFGLYTLFFEGLGSFYLALCYSGVILLFGGLYLVVGKTKYRHLDALHRVRDMRKRIQESKKRQQKIKRKIVKDKDESSYNLEDFDREIESYQHTVAELLDKKNVALLNFDAVTSEEIKRQIIQGNEESLNALKTEYHRIHEEGKSNLEALNTLSLGISTEYESVIGKEFLTVEKLDLMSKAIEDGTAKNIEEAIMIINQKG